MWFKRRPTSTENEKENWQTANTISRPMSILMSFIVFVVCVVIIFSLFLGGRWLYHVIWGGNNQSPATAPISQTTANTTTSNTSGSTQTQQTASSSTNQSSTSVESSSTPNTGVNADNLIGLFVGSTVAGTFGYRLWIIRRQSR
jgi:cytoskeletal protein RodZ